MTTTDLGTPSFGIHPDHGIHDAGTLTPQRRPDSVRRTTSMDMIQQVESPGDLRLQGYARDLRTNGDGTATVLDRASLRGRVDMLGGARLTELSTDPTDQRWAALVGKSVMGGLRGRADMLAPEQRDQRTLLYALVDDLPVTTLISGHALATIIGADKDPGMGYLPVVDQCAGFISNGTMMGMVNAGIAPLPTGPVAPDLAVADDPIAWHATTQLPVHGMRRLRRIDVALDDGLVTVDAMFRDTYIRADGVETIIHEYDLAATIDHESTVIISSKARPRVLPWKECPKAVGSAERVAGMRVDDLHDRVRRELKGTSTCTHLNDLLRSVGDVRALMVHLQ